MNEELLLIFLHLFGIVQGFVFGYIMWAPESNFKRGFVDGLSLKFIWGKNSRFYTNNEVNESPTPTITAEMVKRLREETNRPLMECKKALYACNGDYEQAKQWLLDQRYYWNKI